MKIRITLLNKDFKLHAKIYIEKHLLKN